MSEELSHHTPSRSRWPLWAVWAVYLGVSWTWCIGMFLPVLLLRDYGLESFFVFAVPNVVGAAAMGFLLRRESSRHVVAEHRTAVRAFSFVTILFQAFFVGWVGREFFDAAALTAAAFAALVITFFALFRLNRAAALPAAVFVAIVSLVVLGFVVRYRHSLGLFLPADIPAFAEDIFGLSCACFLGFILCPYLDVTFHHARQNLAGGEAKLAFSTGFGVIFLAMIVLTLLYADLIGLARLRPMIALLLAGHVLVQAAFTTAAHAELAWNSLGKVVGTFALAGGVVAGGALIGGEIRGFSTGEFVYRAVLVFYGLLAPAYVWLFLTSSRRANDRRAWAAWFAVVCAASPFYYLAFIEKRMAWAAAGVAVVLVARFAVPRREVADFPASPTTRQPDGASEASRLN